MFTTKLEVGLAIAVVLLILAGIGDLVARHRGAEQCVSGDKAVVATAQVKNAGVEAAGTVAGAAEDQARANALTAPVAPTPSVAAGSVQPPTVPSCPHALPAARSAPAAGQPGADVRAADAPGVVQPTWDSFIESEVQRARDADIEIADRDRLLVARDAVCRGLKPPTPGPLP